MPGIIISMSDQYWTIDARRYYFDVRPMLDADIQPPSANIGPIFRRRDIVAWEVALATCNHEG